MGIQGKTVLASLIMILLVVFFTFSAHAEKKPKYGGTLVQGVPGGLTSLDAHQARGGDSRRHVGQYNDYLLKLDREQNLIPGLAESWELPDQTTVVLHLKRGVTFQDGTEFNAEAVKFNFDRIAGRTKPKIISPGAITIGRWEVGIVDAYTVKIKLKRPDATALSNLPGWFCAMLSPTAVKKLGEKFIQQPVGLGPFVVKKYVPGSYLLYEKWDGYWKKDEAGNKLPYIDQQKVMIIPDATTKMAALRSGTIDVDQGIAVTQARQLKKDPKVEVLTVKGFIAHFIAFATLKPPLDNVWLRKAINYAIDRKEILVSVNHGEGSIATSFFSPISWAHDPNAKWYEYSPEKAKEALKKGGETRWIHFHSRCLSSAH